MQNILDMHGRARQNNYSNQERSHTDLSKIMGQIQARTGKIPTLDDALKELLENWKKKLKLNLIERR